MTNIEEQRDAIILVVDDEPVNLAALSELLKQYGHNILVANNGEKAVNIINDRHPDLVLLDIHMPGMSGIEVCRIVKENRDTAATTILFLTASNIELEEAFDAGGVDYILKPFVTRELIARVNTHLKMSRLMQSLAELNASLEDKVKERTRELVSANANLRKEINERRHLQDKVEYLSRFDFVTRMYNRVSMEEHLANKLVDFQESPDNKPFFLYLDLDQFKVVNDTCGHLAGDELLRQLGELIKGNLNEGELIARMGGDEFAIFYNRLKSDEAIEKARSIKKIIEDFRFQWEDEVFQTNASIGLIEIDESFDGVEHLISIAERTCHESKRKGGGEISVYNVTKDLIDSGKKQMRWVPVIQKALQENHFYLCGQRINALDDSSPQKLEILIRLLTPDNRALAPGQFIPLAEKYHLISSIDRWVIENTLQQKKIFEAGFQVSINLSGETIIKDSFADHIVQLINSSGIRANQLCFEITETSALSNIKETKAFIEKLKELGCQFALDDFGTGTSSYGYLKELPVDYIKIDGIFVRDIEHEKINRLMVESISAIAKEIGIQVVAECVENQKALDILKEINIDYVQGFYLHKPTKLLEIL